jgi:carboxyl-terminal processing protease
MNIARICAALMLVAAAVPAAGQTQVLSPSEGSRDAFAQFAGVLDALHKHYIEPAKIPAAEHTTRALREFVRSVDPEADLLAADELAPAAADAGDVGLVLWLRNGLPTVIAPRAGSPAQLAGLLAGEQIVAIAGKSANNARMAEIAGQLRGPVGSKVSVRVLDPVTGKTREVTLVGAARSTMPASSLKFLSAGIGYLRVSELSVAGVERLRAELKRAATERVSGVILDLRNNATGDFDAAVAAAQLFVPAGKTIVALEYASPSRRTVFASDNSSKYAAPVALLVNGGTAGEAEIFAAALRDCKRAWLVGSKTFGQGRLFKLIGLPDGSALHLPTALYVPPSGKSFHATGLPPDVPVSVAREIERNVAVAGYGEFDWVNDKREVLKTDLALARALELLTGR